MLSDRAAELRKKAKDQRSYADMLMRSGQQKERDWAVWGGIANGIAGVGACGGNFGFGGGQRALCRRLKQSPVAGLHAYEDAYDCDDDCDAAAFLAGRHL